MKSIVNKRKRKKKHFKERKSNFKKRENINFFTIGFEGASTIFEELFENIVGMFKLLKSF